MHLPGWRGGEKEARTQARGAKVTIRGKIEKEGIKRGRKRRRVRKRGCRKDTVSLLLVTRFVVRNFLPRALFSGRAEELSFFSSRLEGKCARRGGARREQDKKGETGQTSQ